MAPELPMALAELRRGAFLGRLEGVDAVQGLLGWACRWPPAPASPLVLPLLLEDLLQPGSATPVAELIPQQPRPDLQEQGLEQPCGFRFWWSAAHPFPAYSQGLVLRLFFDPAREWELPGSPLRIDADLYRLLYEQRHRGPVRGGGLTGLNGARLAGWGRGTEPCSCGSMAPWPWNSRLRRRPPPPPGPSSSSCPPPAGTAPCTTSSSKPLRRGARSALRAGALPAHPLGCRSGPQPAPFPDQLSPLARERYRSLHTWLAWADAHGTPLPRICPCCSACWSIPSAGRICRPPPSPPNPGRMAAPCRVNRCSSPSPPNPWFRW